MPELDLNQYKMAGLSFEVRYDTAYGLWDHAGQIALRMRDRYKSLKLATAQPGQIVFNMDGDIHITFEIEKSFVLGHRLSSRDIARYTAVCDDIDFILQSILNVERYSRVGLRPTYVREFKTAAETTNYLYELGISFPKDGQFFGIKGSAHSPSVSLRWESSDLGVTVGIKAQTRKIEFQPSFEFDPAEIPGISKEKEEVVVDLDYFTKEAIAVGKVRPSAWIQQVLQVLRRDMPSLFRRGEK